jgi:L-ascorbate metabolism protein UlaG (beta-lactamase superfamily)
MTGSESYYLKPNIRVEPLADHWYVWPLLIPPATASRYLTEHHLKIMESYMAAPQMHATAVKNPKMLGGPFIDYDGKRVGDIKALYEETKKKRAAMLELSCAIQQLENMLRANAKGHCLHPLYNSIPRAIRGYVELVYDLNNNPSFRLIEPLLYRSRYYDRSGQSLMLSVIDGDDRPFILSTPRLDFSDGVQLPVPFDDGSIDPLFQLRSSPKPLSAIYDQIDLTGEKRKLFETFLTTEMPAPYNKYIGAGVRWRYFGHACILVEVQGASILFDPVLSYTYQSNISRYTYLDLPDTIDCVVITHNHQDHVLFETLLQIRHKVKNIIVPRCGGGALQDPSLKLILENCGFSSVTEMNEMGTIKLDGLSFTGLPFFGEHADLNIQTKMAYLVEASRHRLLFAADSCNIEPMVYEHIQKEVGDVDALFIGMECDGAPLTWLYGSLFTRPIDRAMDASRRLSGSNYEQASDIVRRFNCKEVYVYAMGMEPWLNYIMSLKYTEQSRPIIESNKLLEYCTNNGITAERLFGEKEILLNA